MDESSRLKYRRLDLTELSSPVHEMVAEWTSIGLGLGLGLLIELSSPVHEMVAEWTSIGC